MTLSVTLGWWLAPSLVTAASFAAAWWKCVRAPDSGGGYFPMGAMMAVFLFPLAAIASLVAWLIWALVT